MPELPGLGFGVHKIRKMPGICQKWTVFWRNWHMPIFYAVKMPNVATLAVCMVCFLAYAANMPLWPTLVPFPCKYATKMPKWLTLDPVRPLFWHMPGICLFLVDEVRFHRFRSGSGLSKVWRSGENMPGICQLGRNGPETHPETLFGIC